jgi:DNA invertase Pin-like site-specific DNA recombinase
MGRKKRFISYIRVSTTKQGDSGLGLNAQREAVSRFLTSQSAGPEQPIAEYVEVESGKASANRPQLLAAIAHCRKEKAVLVIAKLDRLMLHLLAAFAEHEREAISTRTKAALEAAKARGTKLGNPRWEQSLQAARDAKKLVPPAPAVMGMMQELRGDGLTLRAIADRLNALGLRTPKGSSWYASTVRGALEQHAA